MHSELQWKLALPLKAGTRRRVRDADIAQRNDDET